MRRHLAMFAAPLCLWALPAAAQEAPALQTEDTLPPAGQLQIGGGYGLYQGPLLNGSVSHGRLFGAEGLRLALDGRLSALDQELAVTLEGTPALHEGFSWGAQGYHLQSALASDIDLSERRLGGRAWVGFQASPQLTLTVGARAEGRELRHAALLLGAPGELGVEPERALVAASVEAVWREHPSHQGPFLRGLTLSGLVERADPHLGSGFTFTRGELGVEYGQPLPWGMQLELRGRAGITHAPDPGDIPLVERYRLGGGQRFGGLALSPLGGAWESPQGPLRLGGDAAAVGRAALHVPIWAEGGLYAFAGLEAGALRDDLLGPRVIAWDAAAVGGLTWLSPLGPLSLGVSAPVKAQPGRPQEPAFFFSLGVRF